MYTDDGGMLLLANPMLGTRLRDAKKLTSEQVDTVISKCEKARI